MKSVRWMSWLVLVLVVAATQSGCRTTTPAGVKATDPVVANQGDVYPNRD